MRVCINGFSDIAFPFLSSGSGEFMGHFLLFLLQYLPFLKESEHICRTHGWLLWGPAASKAINFSGSKKGRTRRWMNLQIFVYPFASCSSSSLSSAPPYVQLLLILESDVKKCRLTSTMYCWILSSFVIDCYDFNLRRPTLPFVFKNSILQHEKPWHRKIYTFKIQMGNVS